MRTIFEDTNVNADLEEARIRGNERKSTLPILWFCAIFFLVGTWGAYRWADSRSVEAPAPPASLDDSKQTSDAIGKFNHSILDGKWTDADAMLSTSAKQKIGQSTLQDNLLGKFRDYKVLGAEMTQSIDRTDPGMMRVDCLYKFSNDPNFLSIEQKIITLSLVIENNKLVINDWSGVGDDKSNK